MLSIREGCSYSQGGRLVLELTHALGEPPWVCFLCYVLLRIPLFWEAGLAGPGGEVTPYCSMSPSALLFLEAGLNVCL